MSALLGSLLNSITNSVKAIKNPFPNIPALLLLCDISQRSGLSAINIGTNVISRLPEIGISNGPNKDGSDNLINKYTMLIAEEVVKEIKENGVSLNVIGPNKLTLTGFSADGAPVSVTNPGAVQFRGANA